MINIYVFCASILACLSVPYVLAQPGSIDTNFITTAVSAGNSLAIQTDGKILVGGTGITKLSSDGSRDTNFQASVSGEVWSIAVQGDSKILIGGRFTTVNGATRSSVARLNSNGSLDESFVPGAIPSSAFVFSVVPQPDGMILIGGEFSTVDGISRRGIARLTGRGTVDAFFNPGTGLPNPQITDSIRCVALQTDGKILVGGFFTAFNDVPQNNLARLNADGSVDTNFVKVPGPNGFVFATAIQPDGAILLAGNFTSVNNKPNNRIARLLPNGQLDANFAVGEGVTEMLGVNMVSSVKLQPNGDIIIGGGFEKVDGVRRNGIAKLHSNGSLDTDFVPTTPNRSQAYVLTLQSDNKIIVLGSEGLLRLNNFPAGIGPATLGLSTYAGLKIDGSVGGRYRIEYSTFLETNAWLFLTNLVLPDSPFLFIDVQSVGRQQRFYRALANP